MPAKINFEKSMEKLETIVTKMESGDISLEDALKNFEQGIKLIRQCQGVLQSAEQKVSVLVNEQGELDEFDQTD